MTATLGWLFIVVSGVALLLVAFLVAALMSIDAQVTRDHWRQW